MSNITSTIEWNSPNMVPVSSTECLIALTNGEVVGAISLPVMQPRGDVERQWYKEGKRIKENVYCWVYVQTLHPINQ